MTISHQECPNTECTSTDAFSVDPKTGWGKCFSCGYRMKPDGIKEVRRDRSPAIPYFTPISPVHRPYEARGLRKETVQRYRIDVGGSKAEYEAKYPIYRMGEHVGNKVRLPDKRFLFEGDVGEPSLFGSHAFPPASAKAVTVTEGQDDAMAAYEMMGSKYPVVSIHSASTAKRDLQNDFEYLNSFETIVLCFDTDEAGKKAVREATDVGFPLGKLKVLTLRRHKDANDYLLKGEAEAFIKEWWQAPEFKPDGLRLGSDMWQDIIDRKESFTTLYPFSGLNEKTFGIRLSELVVLTADTGVGKTSILKHIEHHLLTDPVIKENNYGVGFLHLEEPNGDTALGLLSVHNSVPYHIPTAERPESELRKAYDELLNNNRVVIWDHFGSNSVDAVLNKVRHMVALGCRYIVLDHLSIIVSDQSGDERKQLDEIATKLKTLTMELDISVIAIIHTNRQGQIRGTAGVEQLANIVLRLERNKTEADEWRRNVTRVTVEKNRFCGYTGPACYLWYNKDTARLIELSPEEGQIFENGGRLSDDEIAW